MSYLRRAGCALLIITLFGAMASVWAQTSATVAVLSGIVRDPTGAEVAHASVHVRGSAKRDVNSDGNGRFTLALPPGTYDVTVDSAGFASYERHALHLGPEHPVELGVMLTVAPHREELDVPSDANANSTDPASNASALILKSQQLAMLSEDDATMQQQLLAMAGGDVGLPAQIYVDGYSGGRFPPKSTIREVRINQNPLSAQYDRRGFNRIEVTTKPGSDKFHGSYTVLGNERSLNARNPYTGDQPPYHSLLFDGTLGGPLTKRSSFFVSADRNDLQYNSVINAVDPDVHSAPTPISEIVPSPQLINTYSGRFFGQPQARDVVNVRYEYNNAHITNAGLGPLTLKTEAYESNITTNTLQLGATHVFASNVMNEARFQYVRLRSVQDPVSNLPTLIVQGAFNGGGAPGQKYDDHQDNYEFQEHVSWDQGAHSFRTGMRYRVLRDSNFSTSGYNKQYIFSNFAAYQNSPPQPSLLNETQGQPSAVLLTGDLGAYAEDTWKLRKDLTLGLGLRAESQFAIPDHWNPAPRISLAWAVPHGKEKKPLLVVRSAFAVFYDRFPAPELLQSVRQDGIHQTSSQMQDPPYCQSSMVCNRVTGPQQTGIHRVDPNLRSQYDLLGVLSVERGFGARGSVSLSYSDYRGVHQFLLRNANAPLPGTFVYGQPNSGVRPLGGTQNVYQYSSNGITKGRSLTFSGSWYPAKKIYLLAFYSHQRRYTDAGGSNAFTSNPYNVGADYGRSGVIASHRLLMGGSGDLPWGFGISSFISAHTGLPFNVITGQDGNGDTIFNDRPAFATDPNRASVVYTGLGAFDINPQPSQAVVPSYYGNSPSYVSWQLSLGRSFKVGPRPLVSAAEQGSASKGKADRPWEYGFSAEFQNLLNHTNSGTPVGVLTSPFFGRSISLADTAGSNPAANRTITLRTYFTF